ncbi:2OG-Fe(II) oxygenase superfamily domain-containing protein [Penicillium coprophilum]|uniref:2OG-Fe(II) oxygenase superfamily domain-containing protein n=1 Tax=Penicillium coprophilum TaxID=36646 RepID=UPI00239EC6E7|nr:2OG-Fe(II) oxygenase superfamily domain-containing protein [Penicillium coprophilum]KAJ5158052.1 2OG-Fe(II) oxygenase superfamily domain-containing protein [Penicillium coprophilum]
MDIQTQPSLPTSCETPFVNLDVGQTKQEKPPEPNEFPVLDFSLFDKPGGLQQLANKAQTAFQTTSFFYITNFGLDEAEVKEQFRLGKEILELPSDIKQRYLANLADADYNGWRPAGAIEQFPGLRDNWEAYHIYKDNSQNQRTHPPQVLDNKEMIYRFHRHCHENIGFKMFRIIETILEIPEGTLVDPHKYDTNCSSFLRYGKYHPRTAETNEKFNNMYVKDHTDFGSLTFLFSNPISGLQVRVPDGSWKDIPHIPGSLLVITADILQFWTYGYMRSTVHRVLAPSSEQQGMKRYNLIYFMRPADRALLNSIRSPLLERLGFNDKNESEELVQRRSSSVQDWILKQTSKNWVPASDQRETESEIDALFKSKNADL